MIPWTTFIWARGLAPEKEKYLCGPLRNRKKQGERESPGQSPTEICQLHSAYMVSGSTPTPFLIKQQRRKAAGCSEMAYTCPHVTQQIQAKQAFQLPGILPLLTCCLGPSQGGGVRLPGFCSGCPISTPWVRIRPHGEEGAMGAECLTMPRLCARC